MNNIAIFASGSGSNAENIIHFFRPGNIIDVKLVLCNRPDAKVLERSKRLGIDTFIFTRDDLNNSDTVIQKLQEYHIDFIVLAGFLWLIPVALIRAYPNAIINIHPALLPRYGGKGMYGSKVHEAVIANGDSESGITIHYVNEKYDEGSILFQATCSIKKGDTPEALAAKIHDLEYEHFPKVIEDIILKRN